MDINNRHRKKLSPISYLLIICLLANTFIVFINPDYQFNIKEAKAAVGNLHLFWTGGDAPTGWTTVSDGLGEAFFAKFIKGAASYNEAGGSSASHTHTVTTTVYATGSTGRNTSVGNTHSIKTHSHSSNTNVTSPSHLPPYKQIKVIEYDSGVPDTIPEGAVAIFDDTPPDGWTTLTSYDSKFLRCLDDASSTGGSASHTHTVTTSLGYTVQARVAPNGTVGTSISRYNHTHTLASSYTTSSASNLPSYINVILASKDSDGAAPISMIGFFDDTLSYGWTSVSGGGGAFNGKYIQGNSSYGGTGGSNTHSHDDSGYQATTGGSTYDGTTLNGTYGGAFGNHTHAVTFTNFQTVSNEPPYIEVVFAKRTAVYKPEINNWRWYADEDDATPGAAYAAENTTTPQVEMGKSIGFKLRINFTETEGVARNNSRKKMQYATSTDGPWTDVGATNYVGALFRYYDPGSGNGDDNETLASILITGSSSTYKGIHNESNDAAPSNSDHPASTTVEFEYCIENYNAAANTLYYFGFEDELAGEIPVASGKSHPSLTTASVYDLSINAPSSVYLGSWELGSSAYYSHTFDSGEEITIRDNRGQTVGSSSGWDCAAEITTELLYTATSAYCSAVSFNGGGLDDMSVSRCAFTGRVDTDYKIEIDGNPGLDTFKWSDDGGSTWDATNVFINSKDGNVLNNGITILFASGFGHTIGDYWTFTAYAAETYTISKANVHFTTNTVVGKYDAPTTGITGISDTSMGSAVTAATVSGSGKQGLGGFELKPTLDIYSVSHVGEYAGVITFTLL